MEETNPKAEPDKNRIKPVPIVNNSLLSFISRNHFKEINSNKPENNNVPIENKCFLFDKKENKPINEAKTIMITPTVALPSFSAFQREVSFCSHHSETSENDQKTDNQTKR